MEDQVDGEVARWIQEIKFYDKDAGPWTERNKKITKRYKDERSARENKSRFNILWSNVQTLHPALYASPPKPNIDRRFMDDDDLGRVTASALERAVSYFVHEELFDNVMKQVVLDRLLGGRGTAWVRYMPHFKDVAVQGNDEVREEGASLTDDVIAGDDEGAEKTEQQLAYEDVVVDYVHWEDFGHTYARTWEEVRAIWKKAYLSRSELKARFPEVGAKIPLDYSPEKLNETKVSDTVKKATIYEIWDKTSKKVIWIHKDFPNVLDEKDDPLGLKGFFPCPKPLFSSLANDTIIPTPDYEQYKDQANELDELTGRIRSITKAVKVAGVYDSSAEGIQRLLAEGVENQLIPVEQWAVFAEKGGMKGVIDFLPLQEIMQTLIALHDAREKCKQVIYEITGISDIIRGATNPNETAAAQEMKGKFASLRLDSQQKDVARFARDLVRIMTEIIAEHFDIETIKSISGLKLLTSGEKQALAKPQISPYMSAGSPQPMPAPTIDQKQEELMSLPTWEEVEALLRNDPARCFKIDIETDSTIKIDQDADKQQRVELITAVGGYIQQAAQVPSPELQPLLIELLKFGLKGFKIGRELETTFNIVLGKIKKTAENPPPPKPDPAVVQAQAQAQTEQQRMQMEAQRSQNELQTKAQLEMQKMELEKQIAAAELELKAKELQIKEVESKNKLALEHRKVDSTEKKDRMDAKIKAHPDVAMVDSDMNGEGGSIVMNMMENVANSINGMQNVLHQVIESNKDVAEAAAKPRKIKLDKSVNGELLGATSEVV